MTVRSRSWRKLDISAAPPDHPYAFARQAQEQPAESTRKREIIVIASFPCPTLGERSGARTSLSTPSYWPVVWSLMIGTDSLLITLRNCEICRQISTRIAP